jgi:hypothetical protein
VPGIVSNGGQTSPTELHTPFGSTTGGVMTVEAGAITGDLELITRPTPDGESIEALVRYAGARDLYTISGSPVPTINTGTHEDIHQRILQQLTTPGRVEPMGERSVDLMSS